MYPPPQMTFGNRWRRCNALQQALQQHNMNMQLGAIPNINHLGLPGAPPSLYPGQVPGGQVSYACFFLRICMYPPPHMHELLPWTSAGSGLICMFPPPHMHVSSSSYACSLFLICMYPPPHMHVCAWSGRPPVKFRSHMHVSSSAYACLLLLICRSPSSQIQRR